jgi:K(+)-stimulated pyrophosphate-energized sodium pump
MGNIIWLIIGCGLLSIVYGVWAVRSVMAADAGNARMQEIAGAIQEGAQAYLTRQYTTIGIVGAVIFVLLIFVLSVQSAIGFLIGAVLSGLAGFIGMHVSVRANVRTTQASTKSLADGLGIASTRSPPTSAPLVKMPPPRRAKMEISEAPKPSATSASTTTRSDGA